MENNYLSGAMVELDSLDAPGWGFWSGVGVGVGIGIIIAT